MLKNYPISYHRRILLNLYLRSLRFTTSQISIVFGNIYDAAMLRGPFLSLERSNDSSSPSQAWRGPCGKETVPGGSYCPEHDKLKCGKCHNQAVRNCDVTVGPFVCGQLMCQEHNCSGPHSF